MILRRKCGIEKKNFILYNIIFVLQQSKKTNNTIRVQNAKLSETSRSETSNKSNIYNDIIIIDFIRF